MELPGASEAVVDEDKVVDYLLSVSHPVGRFKARFFAALGYARAEWMRLRDDLLAIARSGDAVRGQESPYGDKYEVGATLKGPNGREANVVTVWIVRDGEEHPRFVTAYPG